MNAKVETTKAGQGDGNDGRSFSILHGIELFLSPCRVQYRIDEARQRLKFSVKPVTNSLWYRLIELRSEEKDERKNRVKVSRTV